MKKLTLLGCFALLLALATAAPALAHESKHGHQTHFDLAGADDATGEGHITATRAKKGASPKWYSLSVTTDSLTATDDNGTPEDTTDDTAIVYCLYADGEEVDRGTANESGTVSLDYGFAEGDQPELVTVAACDTPEETLLTGEASELPVYTTPGPRRQA
jgi:hypothetical protein